MKPRKKNRLRQYWGPAVLGIFLLLCAIVGCCRLLGKLSLRSVPQIIFIWLGAIAIVAFFVWLNMHAHHADTQGKPAWIRKAVHYVLPASIVCVLTAITLASLVSLISYHPEHIVEKDGHPLIARVHSFPDRYVYYYQYKGLLFYGQETDYAADGNKIENNAQEETVTAETTQPQEAPMALDIAIMENRDDELVFDISMADFIESYNSFHAQAKNFPYLPTQAQWRAFPYKTAIHSAHETILYEFTADEAIWSQPTVSVYVPANADYIQQVTVNFDEHGYTEPLYAAYEELCFYTLKVFFPELPDETVIGLYEDLNLLGKLNAFPVDEGYAGGCVPYVLYHRDGIGVYPYLAVGEWMHLCIIPVTDETLNVFAEKGVEIHEIE